MMWNIPYIETIIGSEIMRAVTVVAVDAFDVAVASDVSVGADITVSKHNARFRNNGKKVHSSELALLTGAVTTREGRMVTSPELLFLELVSKLSIHWLILLGLQL